MWLIGNHGNTNQGKVASAEGDNIILHSLVFVAILVIGKEECTALWGQDFRLKSMHIT